MPNVAILPTPRARAARAAINPRNAQTCGIHDIAGRLGQAHRGVRYICATIDALIAGAGFPPPFPLYRAGALLRGAAAESRWTSAAVDQWFEGRDPPAAQAAERAEVDSRLSANLHHLFGEVA